MARRLHEALESWRHVINTHGCKSVEEALGLPDEKNPIRASVNGQVGLLGRLQTQGHLKLPHNEHGRG